MNGKADGEAEENKDFGDKYLGSYTCIHFMTG